MFEFGSTHAHGIIRDAKNTGPVFLKDDPDCELVPLGSKGFVQSLLIVEVGLSRVVHKLAERSPRLIGHPLVRANDIESEFEFHALVFHHLSFATVTNRKPPSSSDTMS